MSLQKVYIWSHDDRNRNNHDADKRFVLPINPESYAENFRVEYDTRRGSGSDASELRYKSTAPKELRLEFVFDGTETVENYGQAGKSVHDQIHEFLQTVYNIDGNIHRPRFLEVHWGKFVFPCLLTNLDINYTLFDEDGNPLRAKLNATFMNYRTREESGRLRRNSSPDLTHRRLIQPGDRLDLMAYRIYNDPKYVLQVADANEMTSIRNIQPLVGQEIQFPPIDKTNTAT
ncbi:MAG: hypothetical protein U0U46_15600 [Saprospiraceae bacterium]